MSMQLPHTSEVELAVVVQSKHWTASAAAARGRTAQLSQDRVNSGRTVHCRHLWPRGWGGGGRIEVAWCAQQVDWHPKRFG
jgi:hypothetical protein